MNRRIFFGLGTAVVASVLIAVALLARTEREAERLPAVTASLADGGRSPQAKTDLAMPQTRPDGESSVSPAVETNPVDTLGGPSPREGEREEAFAGRMKARAGLLAFLEEPSLTDDQRSNVVQILQDAQANYSLRDDDLTQAVVQGDSDSASPRTLIGSLERETHGRLSKVLTPAQHRAFKRHIGSVLGFVIWKPFDDTGALSWSSDAGRP